MRNFFVLMLVLTAGWIGLAQEENNAVTDTVDKVQCKKWLSLSHEFVATKNYKEAIPFWNKLHDNCPGFDKAIYIDGVKIYKYLIQKEKDPQKRKELAAKMIALYDERAQYFPADKPKVLYYKGIYMTKYKVGTPEERYETLNELFTKYPDKFNHPSLYLGMFKVLVNKYKKGEITIEELFEKYDELTEHLDRSMEELTKELEELQKKKEAGTLTDKEAKRLKVLEKNIPAMDAVYALMEKELGELGSCETLLSMYSKNFPKHKDDVQWLKRAAKRLSEKECTKDKLFKDIVEALHAKEPSATSARFLAIRYKREGNLSKAMEYYRQALEMETNPHVKAKILYNMAVIAKKQGNKPKARALAMEALKYQPSMGAAYLLIAGLYASSANECGDTKFEKTAIYWKAAEMARKAAQVDPKLRAKALKIAQAYEQRAPSKKEIFLEGMAGKTIKFDKCWVGGSVRVPSTN